MQKDLLPPTDTGAGTAEFANLSAHHPLNVSSQQPSQPKAGNLLDDLFSTPAQQQPVQNQTFSTSFPAQQSAQIQTFATSFPAAQQPAQNQAFSASFPPVQQPTQNQSINPAVQSQPPLVAQVFVLTFIFSFFVFRNQMLKNKMILCLFSSHPSHNNHKWE